MKTFRLLPLLALAVLIGCIACTLQNNDNRSSHQSKPSATAQASAFKDRMLPTSSFKDQVVHHYAYSLAYSEPHEQARWVSYMHTRSRNRGTVERSNDFAEDPMVTTHSATTQDYTKSGFSRGHLCPAGDMKWDTTAMRESFYMSNMSPQHAQFNNGVWKRLEGKMRHWANVYDTIFIVTGPVLSDDDETIGRHNTINVPQTFYKVVYVPSKQQAIAFLVPHQISKLDVQQFATTVDHIEQITHIDFFPTLPDNIETAVESDANINKWRW